MFFRLMRIGKLNDDVVLQNSALAEHYLVEIQMHLPGLGTEYLHRELHVRVQYRNEHDVATKITATAPVLL